ncbi:hypothetical protein [Shouchella miscanthi]|uniref:hypothetical protein n=1 Tax=Shouchella miscanthi TaxID=2598861 RepID=UPI0011A88C93|nr:hypothetical protein [Shouchella miscanthi]
MGLNVRLVNAIPGNTDRFKYDRASSSNYSGHSFKIPNSHGKNNHYEGHARFKATSKKVSIDKRIILSYADEVTTGGIHSLLILTLLIPVS